MATYRATRQPDDTIAILISARAHVPVEGDLVTLDRLVVEGEPVVTDTFHLLAHGGRRALCRDEALTDEAGEVLVIKAGVVVDPPA